MDREMNLHYKIHALVFHSSVRIACFVDFFLFNKVVGPSLSLTGLVSLHFSILVPHNIISCHQDTISLQMIIIFRGPKYGDFARISKHFKRNICGGGDTFNYFHSRCLKCEEGRWLPVLFVRLCVPTPCPSSNFLRGKILNEKKNPEETLARNSKSRQAEPSFPL